MQTNLEKIKNFCSYQERCHQEVRNKLLEMDVKGEELEALIAKLVQENYLNEERFARSYTRGKFYLKEWGKAKIIYELKQRNISSEIINAAMFEIDEVDYMQTLEKLVQKKIDSVRDIRGRFGKYNALRNYLEQKGFENKDIMKAVRDLI